MASGRQVRAGFADVAQDRMNDARQCVLIALTSLAAEGTPRMALALCRYWQSWGIRPAIIILQETPADLAPDFDALGIERVLLNIPKKGYARCFVLAVRVFLAARKYRATALLSMPLGWHAFMALGGRLGGIERVVAHVGNYPNISTRSAFTKFRLLVQLGRPLTDRLACCSRYVQEGAIKHFGVGNRETAVIYNGVLADDFDACAASARKRHPGEPFTIGMVARLEKHKDQATLIRAAGILKKRNRNISVKIVGEGSQRETLEKLVESDGLIDTVTILGMRRDIPAILAEMDLFAFSTTHDEGFGIALVEAMIAGMPVVASDVGACREVLDDGELGLLVPAGDPLALADAIDAVLAAPQAAEIRASLARRKAQRQFSAQTMARAYAGILGVSEPESIAGDARPTSGLAA